MQSIIADIYEIIPNWQLKYRHHYTKKYYYTAQLPRYLTWLPLTTFITFPPHIHVSDTIPSRILHMKIAAKIVYRIGPEIELEKFAKFFCI